MGFTVKTNLKEVGAEIGDHLDKEVRRGKVATLAAMRWAAQMTKDRWRSQIRGVGLGNRLGNTIRGNAYQNAARPSPGAWAMVYSKAPKLIAVHESGATIRSANGFWLAIPTKAAGRGAGGRKITPADWEKRNGRLLRFVYRSGRSALLIDEGRKAPGNVMVLRRTKGGSRLAEPRTFKNRSVVMFTLVPQVRLKKRLDLFGAAERVAGELPARIAALWK
jgi:hypothetical protein